MVSILCHTSMINPCLTTVSRCLKLYHTISLCICPPHPPKKKTTKRNRGFLLFSGGIEIPAAWNGLIFLEFWISNTAWKVFLFRVFQSFSHIQTEYREIRSISFYSVRMLENTDPKNSKYVHFSRSEMLQDTDKHWN